MGAALVLGLLDGPRHDRRRAFYDLIVPARSVAAIVVTLIIASAAFGALGLALAMALPTMQLTLAVTNGIVILLAFISDMFMVGAQMPQTLSTIGWLFPLKHLTALFSDALNPYLTGSGFELDHLAVIGLWGLAGAVVATALLRRDRDRDASHGHRSGAMAGSGVGIRSRAADAVPPDRVAVAGRPAARPGAARSRSSGATRRPSSSPSRSRSCSSRSSRRSTEAATSSWRTASRSAPSTRRRWRSTEPP